MVELEENEKVQLLGCGETLMGSLGIWGLVGVEIADGGGERA